MEANYSSAFYSELDQSSKSSAQVLVPILIDKYHPNSVVDFGCGSGAFIREFLLNKVNDVIGIEGDWILDLEFVRNEKWLQVSDLNYELELNRRVDLALCLEVAEHLDERNAHKLIRSLTLASDRIVFSAAIPGQPGTDHINLQYPEYWTDIFHMNGYSLEWDPRPSIWGKKEIAPWYKQNMLVYSKQLDINRSIIYPNRMFHPTIFPKVAPWPAKVAYSLKRAVRRIEARSLFHRNHESN